MAASNRGGNRGGSNRGRRGQNNNPEGRNQYSGWMSTARENPVTAAAAVGGAVAAGVFLWSRRNQISEWRDGMGSSDDEFGADESGSTQSFMANSNSGSSKRGRKSQAEISEEALTLKETGKATA